MSTETVHRARTGSEHDVEQRDRRPVGRSRRVMVPVVWTLTAALALGAGWWGAERFQSPAQRAAEASAPAPGPVVATVVEGTLSREFSVDADVTTTATQTIGLTGTGVVTEVLKKKGQPVGAGDVILTVNDRPRIALPGKFAFYRDLTPGDRGIDVRQLQEGLNAAGYSVARSETGVFGISTSAAVRALYAQVGYTVPTSANPGPADSSVSGSSADDSATGVAPAKSAPELTVPAEEILVATRLPAQMGASTRVGTNLQGTVNLTLLTGSPRVDAEIPASVVTQIGQSTVGYVQHGSGEKVPVRVTEVRDHGEDGASLLLEPTGKLKLPASGTSVLAVLTVHKGAGKGLIVPSRAVAVDESGDAQVVRETATGFEMVPVIVVGELDGQTSVHAKVDSALSPGDKVRVG